MAVKNLHEKLKALSKGNVSGWELKAKNRRKNKMEIAWKNLKRKNKFIS